MYVEELGETVRAGLPNRGQNSVPTGAEGPGWACTGWAGQGVGGGMPGQHLPARGSEWGLTWEAARVKWRSSGNARQPWGDALPVLLFLEYKVHTFTLPCAVRDSCPMLPALCYSFHSQPAARWLEGVACPAPTSPRVSRFHSSCSLSQWPREGFLLPALPAS